jgi:hypothetical protein
LYVGGPLGPSNYPACNTNPLASSVSTHRTEFVIGDFNTGANPLQEYFLTLNKQPGPSAGTLKWVGDGAQLAVGDPPVERSTDNVIDAWDLQLTAGKRYTIDFSAGNTDAQFYLFHNPGGSFWGTRDNAVLTGNLAATYLAPATASYGFAVVHENSEDGMYSVAVCEGDLPSLASGIVAPVTTPTAKRLRQLRAYWAAAGVRSVTDDWNLELRRGACSLGNALATSDATSGVDFVIGDFNHAPTGDYSVRATRGAGNGNALLEWDDGGDQLLPGMPAVTRRTGPDDVLEVWDAYLVGGRNYEIYFGRLGAADTRLLLFDSQGTAMFGERADAQFENAESLHRLHATENRLLRHRRRQRQWRRWQLRRVHRQHGHGRRRDDGGTVERAADRVPQSDQRPFAHRLRIEGMRPHQRRDRRRRRPHRRFEIGRRLASRNEAHRVGWTRRTWPPRPRRHLLGSPVGRRTRGGNAQVPRSALT